MAGRAEIQGLLDMALSLLKTGKSLPSFMIS
jgi:hypothetical protein